MNLFFPKSLALLHHCQKFLIWLPGKHLEKMRVVMKLETMTTPARFYIQGGQPGDFIYPWNYLTEETGILEEKVLACTITGRFASSR